MDETMRKASSPYPDFDTARQLVDKAAAFVARVAQLLPDVDKEAKDA